MKKISLAILTLLLILGGSGYANTVSGDNVVVTDSGTQKTFNGKDLRVVLSANDCKITLSGHVAALSVTGNNNQVTISGKVDAIVTQGTKNKVTYSKKTNPKAPPSTDLGQGNSVTAGP